MYSINHDVRNKMACMGQQQSYSIITIVENIIFQESINPYGDFILFPQDVKQDKDKFSDPAATKTRTIL